MKSFRFNADYESVLFHKIEQPKLNEVVEFLVLFLEDAPLYTKKTYSREYMDYVSQIFGSARSTTSKGVFQNWWGLLKDLELEHWLNSKLTSTALSIQKKWAPDTTILKTSDELAAFTQSHIPLLAKVPFDMSGRGLRSFTKGEDLSQDQWLNGVLKKSPVILEPFRNRRYDFSHYLFPDGKEICYENIVDNKFQYKGSLFRNWRTARKEDLSFFDQVSEQKWQIHAQSVVEIKNYYSSRVPLSSLDYGFSIDSFIYEEDQKLKIHSLCEVNFRRTMGLVAYDLSRRYAGHRDWTLLLLLPQIEKMREKLGPSDDWIILSPPDARFGMLFLMAHKEEDGFKLCRKVKDLLSLGEFPISI